MFRRGNIRWYDIILIGLAAVIVFPDKVLDWLGSVTGWSFRWGHILLLEALAFTLLGTAMVLLMPHYPRLYWYKPVVAIGFLALMRLVLWLLMRLFGLDDW